MKRRGVYCGKIFIGRSPQEGEGFRCLVLQTRNNLSSCDVKDLLIFFI
ncbi:rCG44798 [Rattus norvegicus]|uniref:RCG44798 n=1 Tax=Rattus norvegicus TaxID=10116 RepID=A6I5U3_RAT|nr:rCG44798 [Rattus norvegicus]